MRRTRVCSLFMAAWAGCVPATVGPRAAVEERVTLDHVSWPVPQERPKFGPPPPGYYRILGDGVAGWTPGGSAGLGPRGATWQPLGPRPIIEEYWSGDADASGRVVSLALHPTDANTVLIASASGGVWKTSNGGASWIPLTDELANLNHGCVTYDPNDSNVIYAGTGEYTTQSGGDGLFRSNDGGVTWERVATAAQVGLNNSRVIVDPSDSRRIHVSGTGGYFRSQDRGQTWSLLLAGSISDLALKPNDPSVVYVAKRTDGIYRSTNYGASLIKLAGGLPTTSITRIILSTAPSAPSVLYAAFINTSNGLRGLYKTLDGGDTWTQLTATPNFPSPQGWYDACLAVDPTDANVVFAGGVFPTYAPAGVIRSLDGGASWVDVTRSPVDGSQLHPDQHVIAVGPDGMVWVGNDGGVWKSANRGLTWINLNATLNVTQNYAVALHPVDETTMLTGTQDNGTIRRQDTTMQWPQVLAGDGGFAAYDFDDPTRFYTTYVYLSVYRFSGTNVSDITGPWSGDSREFIAPLIMDPNDARTLLGGTNRVWRTRDAHAAANWTAVSTNAVGGGGRLTALAVARGASDTIYTGSTTGKVFVTTNAATWTDRSAGLPPSSKVSDIVIHPTNSATAYVSFFVNTGPRILRTTDYGLNWQNVTGTLPAGATAKALAVDWRFTPPDLYVGTGAGIYTSYDHGVTWLKDGPDLPNVNIGDLAIDTARQTITAATYGRGAWRAALRPLRPGDLDADGDVDDDDQALFVAVLVETNGNPDHRARSDLNGDGMVDGRDIPSFVAARIGP